METIVDKRHHNGRRLREGRASVGDTSARCMAQGIRMQVGRLRILEQMRKSTCADTRTQDAERQIARLKGS